MSSELSLEDVYQVKKPGMGIPGMHDSTSAQESQLAIIHLGASTSLGHGNYGHSQKQLPLAALG